MSTLQHELLIWHRLVRVCLIFFSICLLFVFFLFYSSLPFSLQIDLEPEGKVYVVIDLSGSSSEGKNSVKLFYEAQRGLPCM